MRNASNQTPGSLLPLTTSISEKRPGANSVKSIWHEEAGIQVVTFHDLRKRSWRRGNYERRDLMGHSTVEMSDDYTRSSAESRLRAVQSIADDRKQDYSNFTTNQDSETSVRIAS